MELTAANINRLRASFNAAFLAGMAKGAPTYEAITMRVDSDDAEEEYGWLGEFPQLREWLGDRVVNNLREHGFTIKNRDFEGTIGVKRNRIKDDKYGIYSPMFRQLGQGAANHPDKLVYELLLAGFNTLCYDGQNFFDTDHPVIDKNGVEQSVSNMATGGSGEPWFVIDVGNEFKPIIYQERQSPEFVSLDNVTDENVFQRKEFLYGVDYRGNVGFGLWQFAEASRNALNEANFEARRQSLLSRTADFGEPLAIGTDLLLVVGPSNLAAAEKLLEAVNNAAGATNTYKGKARLLMSPRIHA